VRRLVSTYLERRREQPLALALLLLLLAPDLAWNRGGHSSAACRCAIVVLGVAVVATLSRGGMVTFVAGGWHYSGHNGCAWTDRDAFIS
jgi:hypothetical protein